MPRPELSLCLIVRDEQDMIPEFLTSVNGLWDELIAADTGSVDKTVALLEAAGAKVIHFPWIDDFSAARNASLDAATGRWILFLDADERPSHQLKDQIRSLLQDPAAGAATVIMRNEWENGRRRDNPLLRIFRNDPSIRFEHRIHEDVSTTVRDFLVRQKLQLKHLTGVVQHLGYSREMTLDRDKKNRDLDLLQRSLAADPGDFYCWFKILEIARFWDDRPLWGKTAREAADLLATAGNVEKSDLKQRPFSGEFAALVAQGLNQGDENRLAWLEKSPEFCTTDAAWLLRRALFLENLQRLDEAQLGFQKCLDQPEHQLNQLSTVRPRLGLCRIAMLQKDLPDAAAHADQACLEAPTDPEALLAAVTCKYLVAPKTEPAAFSFAHWEKHPQAGLPLARVLFQTGWLELAGEVLAPQAADCAEAALGYLVCCLVFDRDLDLAVDLEQEKADQVFKEWIGLLWQSRKTDLMAAFAQKCETVGEVFPWLPEYLAQETRRLRG